MNDYQIICALSPSEIKSIFASEYHTNKPLGLLVYDALGLNKGTFCGMSEDRFWLYRTQSWAFYPKRHFSGNLYYNEERSKTMIVGKFVYSPWYLLFLLGLFLCLFLSPAESIPRFELLVVSFGITALFGILSALAGKIGGRQREHEILAELEAILSACKVKK